MARARANRGADRLARVLCTSRDGFHTLPRMSQQTSESIDRLFAAAAELRGLVNLFCDRHLDDDLLDKVRQVARELTAKIEQAPQWDRQGVLEASLVSPDSELGQRTGFPYRAIAGPANPSATPMTREFATDVVTSEFTFEPMHSGAPGRGHGGVLAGVLDEFAGAAPRLVGVMAATARLTVNYRAPIPMGVPLQLRVWVHERDGRKIHVHGDAHNGENLIADLEALFIEIDYGAIDTSGAARH